MCPPFENGHWLPLFRHSKMLKPPWLPIYRHADRSLHCSSN